MRLFNFGANFLLINLDLTAYNHLLEFVDNHEEKLIYDPIRKLNLKIQPEELVRQSWIRLLLEKNNIRPSSLSVERSIKVGSLTKRFDLVLYKKAMPFVLFEFKSFKVGLDSMSVEQAAIYNIELRAPYLLISNGVEHLAYKIDHTTSEIHTLNSLSFLD